MKTSDWISMIAIAIFGAAAAVWVSNSILGSPEKEVYSYTTAGSVSAEVAEPDSDLFNVNAINPTVEVIVGDCSDTDGDGIIGPADIRACNEQYEE